MNEFQDQVAAAMKEPCPHAEAACSDCTTERVARAVDAALEAYPQMSADRFDLGRRRALDALRGNW